jgi:hypothetical protein
MAMMLRTGLLAVVSVPGDPYATFGIRNRHRQIVSAEDAQEHPEDHLESPPTRTSFVGRKI